MPDFHKAESAVVRPAPASASRVKAFLYTEQNLVNEDVAMGTSSPGAEFMGGIELGLAVALDNPDAVIPLLASIDAARRADKGTEEEIENVAARAEYAQALADLALGKEATLGGQPLVLPGETWLS